MESFREEVKTYFKAGDIVRVKHELDNRPIMLIEGKEQTLIKKEDSSHFKGMRCVWFSNQGTIEKYVFSTKDLEHYNGCTGS